MSVGFLVGAWPLEGTEQIEILLLFLIDITSSLEVSRTSIPSISYPSSLLFLLSTCQLPHYVLLIYLAYCLLHTPSRMPFMQRQGFLSVLLTAVSLAPRTVLGTQQVLKKYLDNE